MATSARQITSIEMLSGIQRSAVLVMYLGPEAATRLLGHLDTATLQRIGEGMAEVEQIAPDVVEAVVRSFLEDLYKVSVMPQAGPAYALGVLPDLIDDDRRGKVIGPLKRKLSSGFERFIAERPPHTVAAVLRDEHPQTQAVACLLMGADNARKVLMRFEEDHRYDLALRMAKMERIPGELADDVEASLREALDDQGSDLWVVEGVNRAAAVLGKMEADHQESLLGRIADKDEDLSSLIRKKMLTFEDLSVVDDRGIQQILKNVDREILLIALRGASPSMRETLFANVSKRAAEDLRDELEVGRPVSRKKVEEAQEEIVNTALRLKEEGAIALPIGSADDEMV